MKMKDEINVVWVGNFIQLVRGLNESELDFMVRLIRIEVQRRIENEVKESVPENSAEPQKAHKTPEHILAYQRDYYAKNREAISLRRKIRRLKRKEAKMREVHA